ncbi:MAG: chorismate synthase [Lachnospiraceae bacterium]|nr:chorismate synthase [Lachnospiraceae bacterium]
MSSSYGKNIKLTIFGQSHSKGIGMTLEGIPAGKKIDFEKLDRFMERRAPGRNAFSTTRKEADKPEFLSGVVGDTTCGTPIAAVIMNTNTRSQDYDILKDIPRPGHADYTGFIRYGENRDYTGGGHFSGRLTAPMCIAGGIVLQLLEEKGIRICTRIASIGGVKDEGDLTAYCLGGGIDTKADDAGTVMGDGENKESFHIDIVNPGAEGDFPTISEESGRKMQELIAEKKAEGDSVGGIVECAIFGVPAGIGDPMFDGIENKLAQIIFGIPAVKGLEFGNGFEAAGLTGSQNNDAFCLENGQVKTRTNNCGGILGGISDGMPITFRVAFKPTPSIAKEQDSINLSTMQEAKLVVPGRHDPCIVPRAVPVVEAAAALALYDIINA